MNLASMKHFKNLHAIIQCIGGSDIFLLAPSETQFNIIYTDRDPAYSEPVYKSAPKVSQRIRIIRELFILGTVILAFNGIRLLG